MAGAPSPSPSPPLQKSEAWWDEVRALNAAMLRTPTDWKSLRRRSISFTAHWRQTATFGASVMTGTTRCGMSA